MSVEWKAYLGYTVNIKNNISNEDFEIYDAFLDEHQVKTRLDDLLEKYPNIPLGEDGEPDMLPNSLGYCEDCKDCISLTKWHCWHEPLDGGATGKAVE